METRGRKKGSTNSELAILRRRKTMLEDSIDKLNKRHMQNIMNRQNTIKEISVQIDSLAKEAK